MTDPLLYTENLTKKFHQVVANDAVCFDLLPGDMRLLDFNSDGAISGEDIAPIKYPVYPQNSYGFAFGAGFKGVDICLQFYGHYNVSRKIDLEPFPFSSSLIHQSVLDDTSSPEYGNTDPSYPNLSHQKRNNNVGDYAYKDASILRLKSAQISYEIPKMWIKSIGLKQLRIFVNGDNLKIWTDMPVDGEGKDWVVNNYPLKKQVSFGLNVKF